MPTHDDALRDLLFGLLALQNGMVNQPQLVAAFGAWTASPRRPMADLLAEQDALTPRRRELLEAMAEEHLSAHRGDPGESLAALDAGLATPEGLARLASLLRRDPTDWPAHPEADRGDDLDLMTGVWRLLADHARSDTETVLGGPGVDDSCTLLDGDGPGAATTNTVVPADVRANAARRFRLLRPHARGGLGAVFVALDAELNREVALKQILDDRADDPASRARFLLEAEVTGRLEHPGIVPVYSLGTYADGRPFYAMRFIRGDSLKEAIDRFHADESLRADDGRRSLELRKLLRQFTDVCNAIEYAHSRGVLHRDIKPSNVIVGKHGETLVVDWGLTKVTGRAEIGPDASERALIPSPSSGSAETWPGSAMGTPAYMSPEQAEGDLDRLGPRSDVYSLGATLYYMLTGRSSLAGEVDEMLRAAQRGEFRPPRQLDATIDQALESICKKAMALRPADRYSSPRAMAEDVERWMADEPVSAWREPLSRRARRWARRNRIAMATAAAALVAGTIGLTAVLIVQTQAKADIALALGREKRAGVALAAANEDLSRSTAAMKARYELAVEAIRTFHTGVSEDFLLKEPRFKDLRDRLLRSAAGFYEKLGALLGRETDLASRRALARANFEVAELTGKVGRTEDALAAHRSVLAARRTLAAEPAAGAAAQADVGGSLAAVAGLLASVGKIDEALASCREAEALLAGPAAESSEARATLAACRSRMGSLLARIGEDGRALAVFQLARSDQEPLAAADGAANEARRDLADTVNNIGNLLVQTGRKAEAEIEYRDALRIRRELDEANPGVAAFRRRRAESHRNLAMLLGDTGRTAEADAEHRASLEIRRKLVEENPAVNAFRGSLAGGHAGLGIHLAQTGRPAEAEAEFRAALAIQRELADENPTVNAFRSSLANAHHDLGYVLSQTGRPAEAEAEFRAALAIQRDLADRHPAVTEFRGDLGTSHANLGALLSQMGRPAEAEAAYREALTIQRKLTDENPAVDAFRGDLAQSLDLLGILLGATGRPAEADAALREALAIRQGLVERDPAVSDFRDALAGAHTHIADLVRALGRSPEARDDYDRSIAIREALVREVPRSAAYRSGLAQSLRRRGLARRELGDPAGAAADARTALATYDAVASRSGEEWYETACCHAALAALAGVVGSGESAEEAPAEADRAIEQLRRAVAMGYRNFNAFRTEASLHPLRDRADFRPMMMDLAMPARPFAPAR